MTAKFRSFLLVVLAITAASSGAQTEPADTPLFKELDQDHSRRTAELFAAHPELEQDFQRATSIMAQTRERVAAGNFDAALGQEFPVNAVDNVTFMRRDDRAKEIAFLIETCARLGPDDVGYDLLLWELAEDCVLRGARGDADRAVRYVVPAIRGMEKALHGRPFRGLSRAFQTLGMAQMARGRASEAVEAFTRALDIHLLLFGKTGLYVVLENDLGEAYRELGDHNAAAREHLLAADAGIRAARAAGDNNDLRGGAAAVFNNLSLLSTDEGDYEAAREFALKSKAMHDLVVKETKGTPDEKFAATTRAMCLRHLASLMLMEQPQGDPELARRRSVEAEGYLVEAVTSLEDTNGPNDPTTLITRLTLGLLYAHRGDFASASKQLDLARQANEPDEPQLRLEAIRLWTSLAFNAERYDMAIQNAQKWLEIAHASGLSPQLVIGAHYMLGLIYTETREPEKAEAEFATVLSAARRSMDFAFAAESERRQLVSEQTLRVMLDAYLSFQSRNGWPGRGGYEQVLAWKGSVFTHQAAIQRARDSTDPATKRIFLQLEQGAQQIASLVFEQARDKRQGEQDDAWREREAFRWKQIDAINARTDQCLTALSSAGAREGPAVVDVADLQRCLPAGAVLVDFLEYSQRPGKPPPGKIALFESRYIAFIVRHDKIVPIDLGPSQPIEVAVTSWTKDKCADPHAGLAVRRLIWDKLASQLDGAKVVLVSPDAALGNLPFGALPDSDGSYLLERYAFASIPVPQLLPALLKSPASQDGPALLVSAEVPVPGRPIIAPSGSPWARSPRLSHAAVEVADVERQFDANALGLHGKVLFGPDATRSEFRRAITSATSLHYAGHAFFSPELRRAIESQHRAALGASIETGGEANMPAAIDSSLLCGLVLAPDARASDDGALTAYEIARMDLRKLNLAVLSGCNTAVGESAGSEGLLSLQRACHVAGARTVVASLWPVEDNATERLMKYFYIELLADSRHRGLPLIALRRAQLKVMHEPPPAERHTVAIIGEIEADPAASPAATRRPPALWAPWVLSGSPGDLAALINEMSPADRQPGRN